MVGNATVVRYVLPCSLLEPYRRFRDTWSLEYQKIIWTISGDIRLVWFYQTKRRQIVRDINLHEALSEFPVVVCPSILASSFGTGHTLHLKRRVTLQMCCENSCDVFNSLKIKFPLMFQNRWPFEWGTADFLACTGTALPYRIENTSPLFTGKVVEQPDFSYLTNTFSG